MKEKEIHKAIAKYLDTVLKPPVRWLHVPNGGVMKVQHAVALKAMGQRKGFPDLLVLHPILHPHIFALEVKSLTGRQSPEQKEWEIWFRDNHLKYEVVRSVDETAAALAEWEIT